MERTVTREFDRRWWIVEFQSAPGRSSTKSSIASVRREVVSARRTRARLRMTRVGLRMKRDRVSAHRG